MNNNAEAEFGRVLDPIETRGREPDWAAAWLGLAYGVTPCLFVPCRADGSVQRVRVQVLPEEDINERTRQRFFERQKIKSGGDLVDHESEPESTSTDFHRRNTS